MGESKPLGTRELWVSLDFADLCLNLSFTKPRRLKSLEDMILLRNLETGDKASVGCVTSMAQYRLLGHGPIIQ